MAVCLATHPFAVADDTGGADPAWPSDEKWGEPSASDQKELDRPIFGVAVTNKVWKVLWLKKKYIWKDPRDGTKWTRYRRVRDGELVTIYVKITAIDLPKKVMGMTGKLIFTIGADTGDMTFPVRTVPLESGATCTEKVKIHVPQATIDREGGNYLRKIKTKDLGQHLVVRLGAVRFIDGTRELYDHEATIATSDVELGKPRVIVIKGPPPDGPIPKSTGSGRPLEVGIVQLARTEFVPYSRGRVWVRPYLRKDGTRVRGHWRRRPRR